MLLLERDNAPDQKAKLQDGRAILAIRELGGEAFFDTENSLARGNPYIRLDSSKGDVLLVSLVPHLKSLSKVTGLHLNETQVTDAGLAALEGLNNIEHINLEKTAITDAGLSHLQKMTHLGLLIVSDTHVTSAGVARLTQALPQLHVTNLSHVERESEKAIIGAGGILYSDQQGKLKEVRFTRSRVTDAMLRKIQKDLEVWQGSLKAIDLTNSPITDQGLEALANLTALRQLTLVGTDVTVAGVKSLQKSVPNLKVKH